MFKEFKDKWEKEILNNTESVISKIEQQYNQLWDKLLQDITANKLELEKDVELLRDEKKKTEDTLSENYAHINDLANKIRQNSKKSKDINTAILKSLQKLSDIKDNTDELTRREEAANSKEKELTDKDNELKIREVSVDSKERKIKDLVNRLNITL